MRLEEFNPITEKVDCFLKKFLSEINSPLLRNACDHALFPSGKRIRAGITCLTCKAVGGDIEMAIPSASAIELLHNASLVYDDILSENNMRRNKPSVYAFYGKNLGVVVGGTLHSGAFKSVLSTLNMKDIDYFRVINVLKAITDCSLDVGCGVATQINRALLMNKMIKDLKTNNIKNIKQHFSEKDYLDIIQARTGILVGTATRAGAILGGGTSSEIEALWKYGLFVGTGYQIIDDLLDVIAMEDDFGKPLGRDIKAGDLNLIISYALENTDNKALQHILNVWGNKQASDQNIKEIINILKDCGSIEYAKAKAEMLIEQGIRELENLKDTEERELMRKFTLDMGLKFGGVK